MLYGFLLVYSSIYGMDFFDVGEDSRLILTNIGFLYLMFVTFPTLYMDDYGWNTGVSGLVSSLGVLQSHSPKSTTPTRPISDPDLECSYQH
jgi:hypothetical protein